MNPITPRQLEVVKTVVEKESVKEAAAALKTYIDHGGRNRTQQARTEEERINGKQRWSYDRCECGRCKNKQSKRCQQCAGRATPTATARQLLIIKTVVEMGNVKAVAEKFGISDKTVEFHIAEVRRKYDLKLGVYAIANWAWKSGLVYLVFMLLSGCGTAPVPVAPPVPTNSPPKVWLNAMAVTKAKPTYYLAWSYPQPLPVTGLNFVVIQSNTVTGNWSQLTITNRPPVRLAGNLKAQFFQVYPTNSAQVTLAWTAPVGGPYSYNLNAGPQSGSYSFMVNSHVTNVTVTAVWPTNFYCVKAVDTNGLMSVCSGEVAYSLPPVFPVSNLAVVRQ